MHTPFAEALANKRKRKDALGLEELLDLDLRLQLRVLEKLQECESIYTFS